MSSTAGLGPVGAMGVAVAALAMLTVLPALLLIGGRRAFWPLVPRYGHETSATPRRGHVLAPARRAGSIAGTARSGSRRRSVLGVLALGTLTLDDNLTTANAFRGDVESVQGQSSLEQSFPAGASAPTESSSPTPKVVDTVLAAAAQAPQVAAVGRVADGYHRAPVHRRP